MDAKENKNLLASVNVLVASENKEMQSFCAESRKYAKFIAFATTQSFTNQMIE